jgi:hypothetical protein
MGNSFFFKEPLNIFLFLALHLIKETLINERETATNLKPTEFGLRNNLFSHSALNVSFFARKSPFFALIPPYKAKFKHLKTDLACKPAPN